MQKKSCERYSVEENSWSYLPQLNTQRQNSSLCLIDTKFLYCFGGARIEVYDITGFSSSSWTVLQIKIPHSVNDITSINLNSNHILLFNGCKSYQYILDIRLNPLEPSLAEFKS